MKKPVFTLCLTAFLAWTGSAVQAGEIFKGPAATVPKEYFGLHIHKIAQRGTNLSWPNVRFGSWRLWDIYVTWPDLEPYRGAWDFTVLDRAVALAEHHGVDVILPLAMTPIWASARPTEKSPYSRSSSAEPADMNDWRNYIETVVSRYAGRVRFYEIWNEPDSEGFFSGSPETMAALVEDAYAVVKRIDPQAQVLAPPITSSAKSLIWYERFLSALDGKAFDIAAWHVYTINNAPDSPFALVSRIEQLLQEYGLGRVPIWNTEAGYYIENLNGESFADSIPDFYKLILTQEQAVAYVARAMITGWVAGLERFYWYAWDNGRMGLFDLSEREIKPAGEAYDQLFGWLVGAAVPECEKEGPVWVCLLTRGNREARVIWSTEGNLQFSIPDSWSAKESHDLYGEVQPLSSGVITIGEAPLLVKSDLMGWNPDPSPPKPPELGNAPGKPNVEAWDCTPDRAVSLCENGPQDG